MSMLKRTPLYSVYAEHGAKTIEFGGWELPVQFEGILKEHEAVRQRAGLFDVSHMGEFMIEGSGALAFLQRIATNDVSALSDGAVQYSLMCDPGGGTVDDLLLYKRGDSRYMAVVNAGNTSKDLEWMRQHADDGVTVTDVSEEIALLALQGPLASDVLGEAVDLAEDRERVRELAPFRFLEGVALCGGVVALVSRTGYTGEDGYELYVASDDAVALWRGLLAAGRDCGIAPAGLGARDTLRFEARLPLYGQELSPDISPLEAGLGPFVKLDKGEFVGREALAAQKLEGVARKLAGLEMIERGIPRHGYPVYAADGVTLIGEVTTGTQSPTLKKNLGLALIDSRYAALGSEVMVEIRDKKLRANVVKTPFFRKQKAKRG